MMRTGQGLVCLALCLCVFSANNLNAQADPGSKDVVAEVGSQKLTFSDLEQKQGGQLLQARYQYYLTQRKAVDQLIEDELLRSAASSKNLTVDQLLQQEVYKQVKDPTEDQLQVYYEGLETTEPYTAVRDTVLQHIRELRQAKARAAYLSELRARTTTRVLLTPPTAAVDIENAYIRGSKDAPVMLIEFADYECPYCEKVNPLLQKLQAEYGTKLALAYKDIPLSMHRRAQKAAEAARCAGDQGKFWEFHDVLYYSKQLDIGSLKEHARVLKLDGARFEKCLDDGLQAAAVKKDADEGRRLGLSGTPSFFVNGHFLSGAVDYGTLKEMVDQQLALAQKTTAPQQQVSQKK